MITKEQFLKKYCISEELFQSAEISWENLVYIYEDFSSKHDNYQEILNSFFRDYLADIVKNHETIKVHSIRSRIKDPEHLIAKIIRKKQENQKKYKNLDKTNYEKFVTDLIGIRCLILFKVDWQSFHNYILSKFDNQAKFYVKDPVKDFDEDKNHYYIAEKPKVHIRNGDARELYEELLPPDSVIDGKVYRSVHYIIKYKGVYLEIQVRTLFEEGWGEVNHKIVYPYYENDKILGEYTELLNRLSGLADEMSGFFCKLKNLEINANKQQNDNVTAKDENYNNVIATDEDNQITKEQLFKTKKDCLEAVLKE